MLAFLQCGRAFNRRHGCEACEGRFIFSVFVIYAFSALYLSVSFAQMYKWDAIYEHSNKKEFW
jgi:hypothetical protein